MVYLFIGPSGSGKDTQAQLLSEVLNIPVTGTGEIMRREVASKSELGRELDASMRAGEWPRDELVVQVLKGEITKPEYKNGFILTGYPRRVSQVGPLDEALEASGMHVDKVVHFDLNDEEAMNRMRQQANEVKRNDSSEESMRGRLASFAETIEPILHEYDRQGKLLIVDAAPSAEEIHKVVREKLGV